METLTIESGPGGTELLVRTRPMGRDQGSGRRPSSVATDDDTGPGGTEVLWRARPVLENQTPQAKAPVALPSENSAGHLRQTVEATRVGGSADKLQAAVERRQRFWMDTCREVIEMQSPTREVMELHMRHGCRFRTPLVQQVQSILDALDAAMSNWDRDHPELFFQALELNFPEMLRFWRAHRAR